MAKKVDAAVELFAGGLPVDDVVETAESAAEVAADVSQMAHNAAAQLKDFRMPPMLSFPAPEVCLWLFFSFVLLTITAAHLHRRTSLDTAGAI